MPLTLENKPLGYEVSGPEAVTTRDAYVGVEQVRGKVRLYVTTKTSWMSPDRAARMAAQIGECVAAIEDLLQTIDPDLLHESHEPAAATPGPSA